MISKPLISEIAELLHSWNMGVLGATNNGIWIGDLPQDAQDSILIVQAPSPDPEIYIDHETIILDFWVRSNHADVAIDKIQQLYDLLHRRKQYATANWYIFLSSAQGQPVDMSYDAEGGKLMRLAIQFLCRNVNTLS